MKLQSMESHEDIARLFSHFGGQASDYQEFGAQQRAEESKARWPLLTSMRVVGHQIPPPVKISEIFPLIRRVPAWPGTPPNAVDGLYRTPGAAEKSARLDQQASDDQSPAPAPALPVFRPDRTRRALLRKKRQPVQIKGSAALATANSLSPHPQLPPSNPQHPQPQPAVQQTSQAQTPIQSQKTMAHSPLLPDTHSRAQPAHEPHPQPVRKPLWAPTPLPEAVASVPQEPKRASKELHAIFARLAGSMGPDEGEALSPLLARLSRL